MPSRFSEVEPAALERYLTSTGWRFVGYFENVERYYTFDQQEPMGIVVPTDGASAAQQAKLWNDLIQIASVERRSVDRLINDITQIGRYRFELEFSRNIARPERLGTAVALAAALIRAIDVLAQYDQSSTFRMQRPGEKAIIDVHRLDSRIMAVLYSREQSSRRLLRNAFEQLNRVLTEQTPLNMWTPAARALRESKLAEVVAEASKTGESILFRVTAPAERRDEILINSRLELPLLERPVAITASQKELHAEAGFKFGGLVVALRRGEGPRYNQISIRSDATTYGWKTARVFVDDDLYAVAIQAHANNSKLAGTGTASFHGKVLHIDNVTELSIV